MMRQMNLLPAHFALRARQRKTFGMVLIGGLGLILLVGLYWVTLGTQVAGAKEELAAAQASNARLETEIAKLQKFDALQVEVQTKAGSLLEVFAGDVAWTSLMNDVAMVAPGEIWLKTLTGSAGTTEGSAPVGTETAAIPVGQKSPFGRIQFTGTSLDMPGIGKWMMRLEDVKEFQSVWLNSATETAAGEQKVYEFDTTIELTDKASSLLQALEELAGA